MPALAPSRSAREIPSVKEGPGLTLAESPNEIPNNKKPNMLCPRLCALYLLLPQQYHKARTLRLVGMVRQIGGDGSAKSLGNAQSEPATRMIGATVVAYKGLENAGLGFGWHPRTVVADAKPRAAVVGVEVYGDVTASGGVGTGVVEQDAHNVGHVGRVTFAPHRVSRDGAAVVAEIGGDVAVHAPNPADPWLITVEHPHTTGVLAEIAALLDALLSRYSWANVLFSLLIGVTVGLAVAWFVLPTYLHGLIQSMVGDTPKMYWYVARSAGVVAYVLVWLSVVWGLLLTTTIGKQLGQVAPIVDMHRHLSWLAVSFALGHAVVLLGDKYITYTLWSLFVPYAETSYRPLAVALGQIGWYALVLVTVSFWVRTWTGQKVWRALHYLSFVVFVLVAAHALLAGTDVDALRYWYAGSAIVVLFLSILRLLNTHA